MYPDKNAVASGAAYRLIIQNGTTQPVEALSVVEGATTEHSFRALAEQYVDGRFSENGTFRVMFRSEDGEPIVLELDYRVESQ